MSAPTVLLHAGEAAPHWQALFAARRPSWRVVTEGQRAPDQPIDYLVGSRPPAGQLARLPRLRAVFALGAGVDALLAREDLPPSLPVVRLLDAGMADQMVEYALFGVLLWQRRLLDYALQQGRREWRQQPPRLRAEVRVGVLGLGAIGAAVAIALARLGYRVSGWSRSARHLPGIRCVDGIAALDPLLADSDVLINLLPSTPQTRGLLDRARLARLPRGALLVNAARGDQLDAEALCALLDDGVLGGALLDVFATEPLPADSPLWSHSRVVVTPHVAALTLPGPAVEQIVANIERDRSGQPMLGVVDRARAY